MRKLLIKIIRDNEVVNWVGRRLVKALIKLSPRLDALARIYRVYGIVTLNVNDVEFKIYGKSDDHIASGLYYSLSYEDDEFRLLKQLVTQSRYMVDVGANTGIFSIYAASINPQLQVLSFEPHPSNYNRLSMNVSLNGLSNIKLYENAIGSVEKDIEFTIPADLTICATASVNDGFARNFHNIDHLRIAVMQRKLDDVLASVPLSSSDVLKIDVEYYELEVLKGAEKTLREKRPMIMIELLDYKHLVTQFPVMKGNIEESHASDIISFLTSIGYHLYSIGSGQLHRTQTERVGRNFLFVAHELPGEGVSFDEISNVLNEIHK